MFLVKEADFFFGSARSDSCFFKIAPIRGNCCSVMLNFSFKLEFTMLYRDQHVEGAASFTIIMKYD